MNDLTQDDRPRSLRVYHRIAWLMSVSVFVLIWVGGLVTTNDAGMAVPDWPGTYGYNMFLYPVSTWYYGPVDLFLEHAHRLLASFAGLVCIALVVTSFFTPSKQLRWLTIAALLLIIGQGVLGGFRVRLSRRDFALIHGVIGPAFFAFSIVLLVVSSKWWQNAGRRRWWTSEGGQALSASESKILGSIWERLWIARSVALVTVVLAYLQLILGANVRHLPEMPMATTEQFRIVVWFHVLMAVGVTVSTVLLVTRSVGPVPGLNRSRWFLMSLILIQLGLGFGTWIIKYGWPEMFDGVVYAEQFRLEVKNYWRTYLVTAHVAVGSLILATSIWSLTRLWRAEHSAGELLGRDGDRQWQALSKRHLPLYN